MASRGRRCGRWRSRGRGWCALRPCVDALSAWRTPSRWVKVRAVGREEQECGSRLLDGGTHGRRLVARQVVHDNDVAGRELGQDAGHVGGEASPFIGPSSTQGATMPERRRPATKVVVPMPVRHTSAQPFTAWCPAIPARHGSRCPGIVDEDQAVRIEIELAVEPVLASL